jgi:hypothetical protein
MNKNAIRLGAAAAALIVTTAVVAGISNASSFRGTGAETGTRTGIGAGMGMGKGMMNQENREAMESALESNDYNAWKAAAGETRMAESVTAENFSKFASAHELMQAGKTDEAEAIFTELGIDMGGKGMGRHGADSGRGMGNNEAAIVALDNNDFAAWQKAVGTSPIADKIDVNNFPRLVEAHNLQKQARSIMEELGLERGFGKNF